MFYIYRITNNINGKTYVGQRKCPKNKTPMEDTYMGSGKRLWEAYRKYGKENFTKTIIHRFFSRKMTNLAELYYIKKEMQRGKDCYNLLVGAHWEKSHTPWNKGKKIGPHTEEWKAKVRGKTAWNKGKHTGIAPWNKGKKGTPSGMKGKHFTFDKDSEEYKRRYLNRSYDHEKLSAAHKGHTPWNKGKKGLQTAWNKGKPKSEEVRRKISETLKGQHQSEETKRKRSEALKAYWAAKKGTHRSEETKED